MHYEPRDMEPGLRCRAHVKHPDGSRRLEDVELTWVSHDGYVVEAVTVEAKRHRAAYACSSLLPPDGERS